MQETKNTEFSTTFEGTLPLSKNVRPSIRQSDDFHYRELSKIEENRSSMK